MVPTSPRKKVSSVTPQPQQGQRGALPSTLKGKGLNPRAATFSFDQSGKQQQSTSSSNLNSQHPSPILLQSSSLTHSRASSSSAVPSSAPAPAPLTTTHISPTTSRPTTLHRTSSHSSLGSSSSSSTESCCSLLPTLRSFRRAHYLQFALTFLLCSSVALALGLWKKEVRLWEVGLGAGAWLAAEGLKEVVFEIFGPRLAAEVENEEDEGDEEEQGEAPRRMMTARRSTRGLAIPTAIHAILQESIRLGAICCMVALLPDPISPSPSHPSSSFLLPSSTFSPELSSIIPSIPPPHPPGRRPRTLPPLDTLFFSALWFGMGWAVIEIIWASRSFWAKMALYDDVLLDDERRVILAEGGEWDDEDEGSDVGAEEEDKDLEEEMDEEAWQRNERRREAQRLRDVDAELEARQRELEREEVEGQLGVPLWELPVGVVLVWRLDSYVFFLSPITLSPGLPLSFARYAVRPRAERRILADPLPQRA